MGLKERLELREEEKRAKTKEKKKKRRVEKGKREREKDKRRIGKLRQGNRKEKKEYQRLKNVGGNRPSNPPNEDGLVTAARRGENRVDPLSTLPLLLCLYLYVFDTPVQLLLASETMYPSNWLVLGALASCCAACFLCISAWLDAGVLRIVTWYVPWAINYRYQNTHVPTRWIRRMRQGAAVETGTRQRRLSLWTSVHDTQAGVYYHGYRRVWSAYQ